MADHSRREFAAFDLRRPLHLAGEVVCNGLGGNRTFKAFEDQVGCLLPIHIFEHHDAGENDTARIHHILIGVLGSRAVCSFEDGMAGDVVDIPAGSDADPADLGGQGIGKIITIEIQRRDDIKIFRAGQDLLKRDIRDGVFNDDARAGFAVGDFAPGAAVDLAPYLVFASS